MLLAQLKTVECFFDDRGGEVLLILFNEMGMQANGISYWGETLARKLNLSAIGFVTTERNWFPDSDMHLAIEIVFSKIGNRFSERICYGLSQGGYAAIKYSRALHATMVMSFSPQYSISPGDTDDPRFKGHYREHLHSHMTIVPSDISGSVFLFYDPHDVWDSRHACHLASCGELTLIKLPFAGHSSVKPFSNRSIMQRLFSACRHTDMHEISGLWREVRTRRQGRAYKMAMHLAVKWPRTACRIFFNYRMEMSYEQWADVCLRLGQRGMAPTVLKAAVEAAASLPSSHKAVCVAAIVATDADQLVTARAFAEAAVALSPDNGTSKWILSRIKKLEDRVTASETTKLGA
jgi:hypothetical protein